MFRFCMTLLLLMSLTVCFAATTGVLVGKVKDDKGNALGYVNITIRVGEKAITGAQSKDNGTYKILNIPPGEYTVRFSIVSYQTVTVEHVIITAGETTTVNAEMEKGTIMMKSVRVYAKEEKIDKGKSTYNSSIAGSNSGRTSPERSGSRGNSDVAANSVQDIVALQSGVTSIGGELHVRGGRANELNYTIDGFAVSDPVSGGSALRAEGLHKKDKHHQELIEKIYIPPTEINIYIPEAEYHRIPTKSYDIWKCRYIHNYMPPPPPPPVHYNNNTEEYDKIVENAYKYTIAEPLSTFSIDVDTAGYSNVRRIIDGGSLPEKSSVRIEELLNYFKYDYPQPKDQHPFAVYSELSSCPWNPLHQLLHIGLKGKEIEVQEAPPSNLVFLLDVSGSMQDANKLPLVKESMKLLIKQMRPQDRVAIVTYASNTSIALQSTSGSHKSELLEAIDQLSSGGSTAGGAGINLAYRVAQENLLKEGNNRIILCTDGDFNTGASSDYDMEQLIMEKRKQGIFLTVLGFGMGNIKDKKMEILADKGNGNYAYLDNLIEAKKVLVNEMSSTLLTIAKDVKMQIEFNPAKVKAYRLIGYENRSLKNEDFNNDKIDAGELGAGHTVTALYELIPVGSEEAINGIDPLKYQAVDLSDEAINSNDLLTLKLRYKAPEGNTSIPMIKVIKCNPVDKRETSENFRFSAAVAGFGLLLKDSQYKGDISWNQQIELARGAIGKDPEGYRREFIALSEQARDIMHRSSHYYKYRHDEDD